jgi:hypothetical protein
MIIYFTSQLFVLMSYLFMLLYFSPLPSYYSNGQGRRCYQLNCVVLLWMFTRALIGDQHYPIRISMPKISFLGFFVEIFLQEKFIGVSLHYCRKKYRTYTHESLVRDSYYLSHTSLLLEISFLYFWWSILHHEKIVCVSLQ